MESRGASAEVLGGSAPVVVRLFEGEEYVAVAETNAALTKSADAEPRTIPQGTYFISFQTLIDRFNLNTENRNLRFENSTFRRYLIDLE